MRRFESIRYLVKLAIGAPAYAAWRYLRPHRLMALRNQYFASHSMSFLERQVLAVDLLVTRMDTATASRYWAGTAGGRFHAHRDHRLTLELVAADDLYRRPMLDEFAAHARRTLRPGASVVEVGCGAGGNLLYLRQQLADLQFRFLGFDINAEVIASNAHLNDDELRFEVRDCFAADLDVPGDLGVIFCAVLTYAREADIRRLLLRIGAKRHGRVLVGISEPALDPEAATATAHNNLALQHGYRRIFREANSRLLFETVRGEPGKQAGIYHALFELAH